MPIVFIPSPAELSPALRSEYERLSCSIERAVDSCNIDLYNLAVIAMQKFYREYFGRDYV